MNIPEPPSVCHIYPVEDLFEHVLEGDDGECWCNPTIEHLPHGIIITHNAADNREQKYGGWTAN